MFDFIVLGLVPGTNVQITFMPWLLLCGGVSLILALRRSYRSRRFRGWLISFTLLRLVRRTAF